MIKGCLLGLTVVVALMAADRPAPPWEKSRVSVGQDLFRENCAVCHEISKLDPRTIGKVKVPSLAHASQKEKPPLGTRPLARPYIALRVKFGGPVMPAFAKKLSDAEINMIIDYIETK